MIRSILIAVLAFHGIIHLLGFAKEWKLGPVERFSGKSLTHFSKNTSRLFGVLWPVACVVLLISTTAYYSQKDWFLIIGIAGLIISQTLVVIYWQYAKWGTIFNVILLMTVIHAAGRVGFKKLISEEVNSLLSSSSHNQAVITEEEVAPLPEIVQKWLSKSNVIGKLMPNSAHVIQKGSMRTDTDSPWMSFDAEQYFTIDPPGFVWNATIYTGQVLDIVGRDKYENGKGNMLIKAASLITIANRSGKEIDQGSLIRYMAELIWFPHAVVSEYLDWKQIDNKRARVTMIYNNITASGVYTFNNDGLPIAFEAQRFGEFNGKYSKETWTVTIKGYEYFNGMPVGSTSEVTWKLKDGDFTWLRLVIVDLEYK